MPQIPEPHIDNLPNIGVGHENVDINAETFPIDNAAKGMGQQLDVLYAKQQQAVAELTKKGNESEAIRLTGEHDLKLSNLQEQVIKQNWNAPDKWVDEFRKGAADLANAGTSAIQNPNVAADFSKRSAAGNTKYLLNTQSQSMHRIAQKIKSDVHQRENDMVSSAAAASTPEQFEAIYAAHLPDLRKGFADAKEDPKGAELKARQRAVSEWVSQNADPFKGTALNVLSTVDDANNPITKSLSAIPGAVEKAREHALKAFTGAGVLAQTQMLRRSMTSAGDLTRLASANDPKLLQALQGAQEENQAAGKLIDTQPIPEEAKVKLREQLKMNDKIMDSVAELHRSQMGFTTSKNLDNGVRMNLINRDRHAFNPEKGKELSDSDLYHTMLALRVDNNVAHAQGKIGADSWNVVEQHLANRFAQINAKDSGEQGSWLFGHHPWMYAERAGDAQLNSLLDRKIGRYGGATGQQQVDIWDHYLKQVNAAAKNGGKFDNEDARKAARDAAEFVMHSRK